LAASALKAGGDQMMIVFVLGEAYGYQLGESDFPKFSELGNDRKIAAQISRIIVVFR